LHNSSFLSGLEKEYGNKLYKNQSAATLTHSIVSYTVPKQERFDKSQSMVSQGSMYDLKSTLGQRGTS